MISTAIMKLLFARVAAFTASPVMPVAWPNVVFVPPDDQRFLRVQFNPNIANRLTIDSDGPHQHLGLLQLSVHWTKGQGEEAAREQADAVAGHFPCDLRLADSEIAVRITKRPDVADVLYEAASIQIPVMIEWECYA